MTFTVPDEVAGRFEAAANACGVRIEDAVVEALTEWVVRAEAARIDVARRGAPPIAWVAAMATAG